MKIWANTNTLEGYIDDLEMTSDPKEADVALLGSRKFELDGFPVLKGIFRAGVGKENVPIREASEKGISVGFPSQSTAEIIYDETAAFSCSMIFRMVYRDVGTLSPWKKAARRAMKDLTLLVIGRGNIGQRVIHLMESFLHVISYEVLQNREEELRGLISEADIITLHIPYNRGTHDFVDEAKLSWMKDNSILINTSRGPIVSEDALCTEIEKGRITAAFDVFWQEPYEGKLKPYYPDRFFMTPHVASTCTTFLRETAKDLREFMERIK